MNILVLNTNSDLYGGSKIISIVIGILSEGKHNPIVVVSETGPLVNELLAMGVEVHIIKLGILRRKYLNIPGIINRVKANINAWKKLSQLVYDKKIELIYSNTTVVLIGGFLAKKRGLKHIWHVHEIIKNPKIATSIIGFLLKKYSDKIIVVSDAVKNHWAKYVHERQILRIYNGINTKPFEKAKPNLRAELNLKDTDLLISMIGRVNHWKGQDYFLEIAENILSKYENVYFVLAGDAYPGNEILVDKMLEKISSIDSTKIVYLGYREDTPNILASTDIFVLPSTQPDPFPTVILEAMASSKPVIATAHGGALEMIVDGETGYHIPYDIPQEASRIIAELIDDKKKRVDMGTNAHNRIQECYSLDSFRKNILKTINTL